jgi:glycosyltransferase involved in cell wall biosynthesis
MKNISVIIPAWNEEATISEVIRKAFNSKLTKEVLVIDDDSTDNTVSVALLSGACVIGSAEKGKGISMQEGVRLATGDYLVFLDADIPTYPEDIVDLMANPLMEGNIDFVKSCFDRQAGRVTELLAKPLLDIYFPELNQFSQPLSGIVSGKRSFWKILFLKMIMV